MAGGKLQVRYSLDKARPSFIVATFRLPPIPTFLGCTTLRFEIKGGRRQRISKPRKGRKKSSKALYY